MDPQTFCKAAIEELRGGQACRFSGVDGHQMIVVLAYYAQQRPSTDDFPSQLRLLAQSAERAHRWSLAAAARALLDDWDARTDARMPAVASV